MFQPPKIIRKKLVSVWGGGGGLLSKSPVFTEVEAAFASLD